MLKLISIKSILTLSAFSTILGMSSTVEAGLLTSWFSASPKEKNQLPNPCEEPTFLAQNGRYCSGLFFKEIRCLTDGKNPGVCDSAAVCNTKNQIAKVLCENHCLNTAPQKLGNQFIEITCSPRYKTITILEDGKNGHPDGLHDWQNEDQQSQLPFPGDQPFHDSLPNDVEEIEVHVIKNDFEEAMHPQIFLTGASNTDQKAENSSEETDNAKSDESNVIVTVPLEENPAREHASKSHEEAQKAESDYRHQLYQAFRWHTPD